jgi:hypothetical protein
MAYQLLVSGDLVLAVNKESYKAKYNSPRMAHFIKKTFLINIKNQDVSNQV